MQPSLVWYIESKGAIWQEGRDALHGPAPSEHYEATGVHELWLMDRGEILARATSVMLACSMVRAPLAA